MLKKNYLDISDETLEEHFISLGISRNLAKTLIHISQIDYEKFSKKRFIRFIMKMTIMFLSMILINILLIQIHIKR